MLAFLCLCFRHLFVCFSSMSLLLSLLYAQWNGVSVAENRHHIQIEPASSKQPLWWIAYAIVLLVYHESDAHQNDDWRVSQPVAAKKKKVSGNQWIRISLFFGWARGGGRKGCAVCTFCSVPTHNRFVVCPFSILFFSRCGRPPFDMCVREIRLTALCVLRKFPYIILRVYVYSIADLESFSGCPSLSSAL